PGWHTECVVMSLGLLGEGFDLHTGGMDLQFPHHENERAQAVALGRGFARGWMHHAFVEVGGEKMSKSLGNFTSLTDLLSRTDPRAYRLLVLQSHYRSPMEVTPSTISAAEESLDRLDNFARRFGVGRRAEGVRGGEVDAEKASLLRDRMDDDLDTPAAMALVFDLVRQANAAADASDSARAQELAASAAGLSEVLGLGIGTEDARVDSGSAELVSRRDAARTARDFAAADAIRDQLEALGWTVEDTPGGTKIRR
ncbi:MAG: DALR domain-containing protein, partial [Acidimicrobiales bacterium]